jgi:hypothetical protein
MGPDPGRAMEAFRSSDSKLATFVNCGQKIFIPCSDLRSDISREFNQQKSDTEFGRMLNQNMGVLPPPPALGLNPPPLALNPPPLAPNPPRLALNRPPLALNRPRLALNRPPLALNPQGPEWARVT